MEKQKPTLEWLINPEVFQVNRIPAHSDHKYTLYGKESRQSLNGTWRFSYAERPDESKQEMFQPNYPAETLDQIQVPGHVQLQGYGQPQYVNVMYPWDGNYQITAPEIPMEVNPVASYVKDVELSRDLLAGKRQYISFQGVENAFYLYVNGEFVGYSEDSFTPSEFDITEYLVDGVNRIGVEVYKWSTGSWLEDQDFFCFSGIFRDVYLYAVPEVHVRDLFVHTNVTDDYKDCEIALDMDIALSEDADNESYQAEVTLKDAEGNSVFSKSKITLAELADMTWMVEDAKLWSAENPYLYQMDITITKDGHEIEKITQSVGMRRFEMIDKVMHINGKRIEFYGVNRHEFSCYRGRSVTEEDMLWDIKFMKRHNINAVRTCHYPNQSRWYELCDEYGIYMIDEANLETHGTWTYFDKDPVETCIPGSKPEWKANVLDRANSMVQRDKNHPAVIIWSCGNESFGGENIYLMSELMRETDPSRLVHYEGIFHDRRFPDTSDMESRMYERIWNIEEYLENDPAKPFVGCEYMHAMGNSCGGIKDYVDLLDKYPMYQGSFIWDYVDQALVQTMPDGSTRMGYGGDFDEVPDDGNFCGDGILFADRTISAKAFEVKNVYQQVILTPDNKGVQVRNKRLFEDTSDMLLKVEMLRDGYVVKTWTMEAVVEPLEEKYFPVEGMEEEMEKAGEYFVQAAMVLKAATKWAEAGYELMTGRSTAYVVKGVKPQVCMIDTFDHHGVKLAFGNQNVGVHGVDMPVLGNGVSGGALYDYDFSRKNGGLISVRHKGREIFEKKPKLCFYRAATDNDKGCQFMFDSGIWQFAERWQRCVDYQVEAQQDKLVIHYTFELPISESGQIIVLDKREKPSKAENKGNGVAGIRAEMIYTVYPDGRINLQMIYHGAKNLPELPLFGVEFALKKEFEQMAYYGIGPMENYTDRNSGGKIGVFHSTVTENYEPYLKPQTCGNRTETRWVTFSDGRHGIKFQAAEGEQPFQFTALHYNEIELDTAPHKEDLPKPYCTYVKIMPKQLGVGGDDSWGSQVREHLHVPSDEDIRYSLDIFLTIE